MNLSVKTCARIWLALAAYLLAVAWPSRPVLADPHDVICCGADEVFVLDEGSPGVKKWSWRVAQSLTIPPDLHPRFQTTDDWWSDRVRFAGGTMLMLSNERLYKVRWDTPSPTP